MKLPRTENTALLLATTVAQGYGKKQVSVSEIANRHGISVSFLKKLARALRQAGLLTSKEGLGGGYTLSAHPSKISVWDILEAVKQMDKKDTDLTNAACPINRYCLPQNIQKTIDSTLKKNLSAVMLEDLL
jgi:Rrf2 family iron-sulfur cluster assembly transcriptional regulator